MHSRMPVKPAVTVITASCGRMDGLHNLLTALAAQDYSGPLEIVIALDGFAKSGCKGASKEGENRLQTGEEYSKAAKMIRRRFGGCRPEIRILELPEYGPAYCRNRAIEAAAGEVLLFTDDDAVPATNWVTSYLRYLEKNPDCAAMGPVRWHWEIFPTVLTGWLDYTAVQFIPESRLHGDYSPILYTCNAAIRRETLGNLRFNETFRHAAWEDIDFSRNLRSRGRKIGIVREAVVYHRMIPTLKGLEKKLELSVREQKRYLAEGMPCESACAFETVGYSGPAGWLAAAALRGLTRILHPLLNFKCVSVLLNRRVVQIALAVGELVPSTGFLFYPLLSFWFFGKVRAE